MPDIKPTHPASIDNAKLHGDGDLVRKCSISSDDAVPMVHAGSRMRTHADIMARAAFAAQGFHDSGIGDGGTIALMLRNDFAFFEASLGATMAGAYAVPLNWHATADEAGYILRDCGAQALVVHSDLLPGIVSSIPAGVLVLVVETPAEIMAAYNLRSDAVVSLDAIVWDGWLAARKPIAAPILTSRTAVIYTSGTTGTPKGVRRKPRPAGPPGPKASAAYGLGNCKTQTVLMNGPMYHSAPNAYGLLAFASNAEIILQPRFDAEEMLALIERHRVTNVHIVPTMFVRLLQLPDLVRARYDLSSLRFVVHGAAPCPIAVKRAMIDWWGSVIHEYYGSTETGLVCGHGSEAALLKPGTVGTPLPGVELRIIDGQGSPVAAGVVGDVYVRSVAKADFEYIGLAGKRAEIGLGEFVTTGDIGYRDTDGYLFLSGRRSDIIISGGFSIYPAEIEAALESLDGIADCAAFGIPDPEFGEVVCVYLTALEGEALTSDSIKASLAARLSLHKLPKVVEIVPTLPREDSGKIFKRKLRDPYWLSNETVGLPA